MSRAITKKTPQRRRTPSPSKNLNPHFFIMGGSVPQDPKHPVMQQAAQIVGEGILLICPAASGIPDEVAPRYETVFGSLGVQTLVQDFRTISEANEQAAIDRLLAAKAIIFTGGDQLLLSLLLATRFMRVLKELARQGRLIVLGTSAGATIMSDDMMVGGPGGLVLTGLDPVLTSRGMGLLPGRPIVIDMHFDEDGGRRGRLLEVLARNPIPLGLGIFGETGLEVGGGEGEEARWTCQVFGKGAVEVFDGSMATHNNVARRDGTLLSFGPRKELMAVGGDRFSLLDWQLEPLQMP